MKKSLSNIVDLVKYPIHDLQSPKIKKIIEKCKSEQPDLINSIISSGKLEEENEKKLTSIILDLKKNFDK